MLKSYYESNKGTTDLLKTYEKNSKDFAQLIHKLKGSSGNFQLNEIYQLCINIELEEDNSKLDELLDKLYLELELTIESIHGVILENQEKKHNSDFDMQNALDELIIKTQEFSLITLNEVKEIINNLPNEFDEAIKKDLSDSFDIKDYEKLEENLLKIKGLLDEK